jgi:AbiV family abortive infection protein
MSKAGDRATVKAGFELPDLVEARIWGVLAAENAERLLASASLLAANQRLGHAIGLAVLAVEEAVKARALFGNARYGDRFSLDEATLAKLLKGDHRLRHFVAWIQGSSPAARRWLASEAETDRAADAKVEAELVALDWLMVANESKNGGFYVDYRAAGHWSTPQAATDEQWSMAMAVAAPFVGEATEHATRNMEDLKTAGPHPLRPEQGGSG